MRKYYKVSRESCASKLTGTAGDNLAWVLLEAVVHASALILPWDELCDAKRVLVTRSVEDYLNTGSRHLSAHNEYVGKTIDVIRTSRLAWSLFAKYPWSKKSYNIDRRNVARNTWAASEDQCEATNLKLKGTPRGDLPAFIHKARFFISEVLGDCRSAIGEILELTRPGKGATLSNDAKHGRVTAYYKFADFPYSCTRAALPYALAAISGDPHWMEILERSGRRKEIPVGVSRAQSEMMLFSDCVDIAEDDRITFVPKNAKTDRPIAIGASLNIMLQLAVNAWLTPRLKTIACVDLLDQSRNQMFAYLGSRHHADSQGRESPNQFSTLDLKSASDTIARELVKLLLPSDWYAFLDDLRHHSGNLDGFSSVNYEKFSAMGNGFTFPLESLIFWAVSKAAIECSGLRCNQDDISIYGDDIIVRNYGAHAVTSALNYCGFSINIEKSFVEGAFKESCGADFWLGHDVRPLQIKRTLTDARSIYYIANSCAARVRTGRNSVPAHYALYAAAVSAIERGNRRYGPLGQVDDEDGSSLAEDYLQVPLISLSHPGLRPWVTVAEYNHLLKLTNNQPAPDLVGAKSRLPCAVYFTQVASQFSGRTWVRYYTCLKGQRKVSGEYLDFEDILHAKAARAGQVTRKGRLESKVVVRSVPNWDGTWSRYDIDRHPAVLMGLA